MHTHARHGPQYDFITAQHVTMTRWFLVYSQRSPSVWSRSLRGCPDCSVKDDRVTMTKLVPTQRLSCIGIHCPLCWHWNADKITYPLIPPRQKICLTLTALSIFGDGTKPLWCQFHTKGELLAKTSPNNLQNEDKNAIIKAHTNFTLVTFSTNNPLNSESAGHVSLCHQSVYSASASATTEHIGNSQSHPLSFIMCATSIIYLPSLYFWLDSNACSWITHTYNAQISMR